MRKQSDMKNRLYNWRQVSRWRRCSKKVDEALKNGSFKTEDEAMGFVKKQEKTSRKRKRQKTKNEYYNRKRIKKTEVDNFLLETHTNDEWVNFIKTLFK